MRSRCFRKPRSERGAGQFEARNERTTKDLRKQIEQARPIQRDRSGPDHGVTPRSFLPSTRKRGQIGTARMQPIQERTQPRPDRRLGEVVLRLGLPAPRAQSQIHAELEVQTQEISRLAEAERVIPSHQGLRRGQVALAPLVPKPVPALGIQVEPHRPAPSLHALQHPAGLGPTPVDQEHLGCRPHVSLAHEPLEWLASRVQDPRDLSRGPRNPKYLGGGQAPMKDRDAAAGDNTPDKPAGARRTPLLASVLEHVDAHRCFNRGQGMAGTPARRKQASVTSLGARKDDAARHTQRMGSSGAQANAEPSPLIPA